MGDKFDKIMEKTSEKIEEEDIQKGLKLWSDFRKVAVKVGWWDSDMQEVFEEMEEAVEDDDRELAEQRSEMLKARAQTKLSGGG